MKASLIRLMAQMICGGYVCSMAEYRNDTARTVGRKSRGRWLASAVGLALTATACSGGPNSAAVPTVQLTSTAPTTVATTTTIQATTTTEDPALAYERDVAEITEVMSGAHDYLQTYGTIIDLEILRQHIADPLLSRKVDNIQKLADQGIQVGDASYEINVLEISIDGDVATVRACNHDKVSLVSNTGEIVVPPDPTPFLRTETFQRTADGWRMTDAGRTDGTLTPCEA